MYPTKKVMAGTVQRAKRNLRHPAVYVNSDPPDLEVADVAGSEKGLFVSRDFDQGEFLLNYRGEEKEEAPAGPYVFEYAFGAGKRYVDATEPGSGLARYINDVDPFHAANCKTTGQQVLLSGVSRHLIVIKTTRPIKRGMYFHF